MEYEIKRKRRGALVTPVVVEKPTTFEGDKYLKRMQINKEVFDTEDAIADNAKMVSLLFSVVYRIYEALPEDVKANLSEEDRAVVEYAIGKFKVVQTRADIQFAEEGTRFVDKLLDRQGKVGEILKNRPKESESVVSATK